jgi:hypothetical protein
MEIVHVHNLQSALWGYLGGMLERSPGIVFTPRVTDGERTAVPLEEGVRTMVQWAGEVGSRTSREFDK